MKIHVGWVVLAFAFAFVVGGAAQQPISPSSRVSEPTAEELAVLERARRERKGRTPVKQMPPGEVVAGGSLPSITQVSADSAVQVGSAGDLIGFSGFDGSGSQTITLVHAGKMQMSVYHIDRSGQIVLASSRPIDADFSLSLNLTKPLPGQIRLLSGQVK